LTRPDRFRYLPLASCAVSGDALPPSKAGCWPFDVNGLSKDGDMRVVTAFKRMLHPDRSASVTDVGFEQDGVIVTRTLRKRRRRVGWLALEFGARCREHHRPGPRCAFAGGAQERRLVTPAAPRTQSRLRPRLPPPHTRL
jgi:hypothetical protein